jgi:hypothetical protein
MNIDKSTYKHTDGDDSVDVAGKLASQDAKEIAVLLGEDVSRVGTYIKTDVAMAREASVDCGWSTDYAEFVIDMYRARCF